MSGVSVKWAGVCGAALPSLLVLASATAGEMRWRVGPVYRGGMETEVSGGSHAGSAGLSSARTGKVYDTAVGSKNDYADRTYSDGYVYRDGGTGNSASIDPNTTWYWGYDHASQYSSSARTLSFHSSGRETTREVLTTASDDCESFDGWGLEMGAELPLTAWGDFDVSLCAGISGFWNMGGDVNDVAYSEQVTVREFTLVDTYSVGSISIPSAPYSGTYDGPFDSPAVIPSPVIPNLPTTRKENTVSTRTYEATSAVDVDVDADLYEFRVGPALSHAFCDGRVRATVSPALTLNVLEVSVDREERWVTEQADGSHRTVQQWSDRASETEFRFGAGLDASADWMFTPRWSVSLSASADWVDSAHTTVGPSRVKTDVSGYSVGLALVRTFGGDAPAK